MPRLTRSFLSAMGIDDDGKQTEIINAHRETVDALKDERDKLKVQLEKMPELEKELEEAKKQTSEDEPYKAKYEKLKTEFDNFKADTEGKETKAKKSSVYKALLLKAGISEKRADTVLKVSDVDSVELDDKGEAKNADALLKKITEDWQDFIVKEEKKGADTQTPPKGAGGGAPQKSRAAAVASRYYGNVYGNTNQGGNAK